MRIARRRPARLRRAAGGVRARARAARARARCSCAWPRPASATPTCTSPTATSGDGRQPIVLGHEGAGIVEAVGEGVDHVGPGRPGRVLLRPGVRRCRACAAGRRNLCETAAAAAWAGTLLDGTSRLRLAGREPVQHFNFVSCFAERCVVPAACAVPIPAGLPLWQAALLGCGVVTAVGAVRNAARVGVGETRVRDRLRRRRAAARRGGAARRRGDHHRRRPRRGEARAGAGARRDATRCAPATTRWPRCWRSRPAASTTRSRRSGSPATIRQAWDVLRPGATAIVVGITPAGVDVALPALELLSEKGIRGSYYGSGDPAACSPRWRR